MKTTIATKSDVELLVREFYRRILSDTFMAPHFTGIDFEAHFPRMIAFWSFILLDEPGYTGNTFEKHLHLNISDKHFTCWLEHFCNTVDSLFEGEKAELAKQRATALEFTFRTKFSQFPKN